LIDLSNLTLKEVITNYILLKKFNGQASNKKWWELRNISEYYETLSKDNDGATFKEIVFIYLGGKKAYCPECGKGIKFNSFKKPYNKFCSIKCGLRSNITKNKRKQTCKHKYGVDNPAKNDKVRSKIASKLSATMSSEKVIAKRKKTCLQKYGNENYNNRDKMVLTKLSNIDSKGQNSFDRFSLSIKQTILESKQNHLNQTKFTKTQLELLKKENLTYLHKEKNMSLSALAEYIGVNKNTICTYFNKLDIPVIIHKTSEAQQEIIDFLGEEVIAVNDRKLLQGKELDIVCSNFAIEYNGLYYHSNISSKYHLNKTIATEAIGLQLYHIFENEWEDLNLRAIWKSVLSNKIGTSKAVMARKCFIKRIKSNEARDFINKNHLQGYCNSNIRYGLFYKNELLAVMTFGKSRFNNKYEYELYRFATKIGYRVVGGASKLLATFEKENLPKSLISYANRRWSTHIETQRSLYTTIGFSFKYSTAPNFWYYKNKQPYELESRLKYQKHKQKYLLDNFDATLSAEQNMKANNYRKIYDSGNHVFVKNYL
jgi:hypothetical protein